MGSCLADNANGSKLKMRGGLDQFPGSGYDVGDALATSFVDGASVGDGLL